MRGGTGGPRGFSAGGRGFSTLNPGPGQADDSDMEGPCVIRAPEYVEKLRVGVNLATSSGVALQGWIALSPVSPLHAGPETLLERLNAGDQVFPLEGGAPGGGVLLVNPLDVECVRPARGTPNELVRRAHFGPPREERVQVRFRSGAEVEGLVRFELPPGFNRISDFLNSPEEFYTLDAADGVWVIHKRLVCATRLYQGSPKPGEPRLGVIEGGR